MTHCRLTSAIEVQYVLMPHIKLLFNVRVMMQCTVILICFYYYLFAITRVHDCVCVEAGYIACVRALRPVAAVASSCDECNCTLFEFLIEIEETHSLAFDEALPT